MLAHVHVMLMVLFLHYPEVKSCPSPPSALSHLWLKLCPPGLLFCTNNTRGRHPHGYSVKNAPSSCGKWSWSFQSRHGTLHLGREGLWEEMTIELRTNGREDMNQTQDVKACCAEGTEWPQAFWWEMQDQYRVHGEG